MQNSERYSSLPWKEALQLGVRIATPLAIGYMARNAVYRVRRGTEINLSIPANRQPLKTPEEKRFLGFLRMVDRYIRDTHDRHGIEVEYESLTVSGSTDNPAIARRNIPHHRPDLAVALRGTLPCDAPTLIPDPSHIAVFELGRTIIGNDDKANQAMHAHNAGLPNYLQLDGDDITNLYRNFARDPDGTLLDIFGEAIFR